MSGWENLPSDFFRMSSVCFVERSTLYNICIESVEADTRVYLPSFVKEAENLGFAGNNPEKFIRVSRERSSISILYNIHSLIKQTPVPAGFMVYLGLLTIQNFVRAVISPVSRQ